MSHWHLGTLTEASVSLDVTHRLFLSWWGLYTWLCTNVLKVSDVYIFSVWPHRMECNYPDCIFNRSWDCWSHATVIYWRRFHSSLLGCYGLAQIGFHLLTHQQLALLTLLLRTLFTAIIQKQTSLWLHLFLLNQPPPSNLSLEFQQAASHAGKRFYLHFVCRCNHIRMFTHFDVWMFPRSNINPLLAPGQLGMCFSAASGLWPPLLGPKILMTPPAISQWCNHVSMT